MERKRVRGLFIVFDGIDGCGKSTQLAQAEKKLREDGFPVITTREPGGTDIAEMIRSVILAHDSGAMVNECELLLYAAARAQHVRQKVLPALERGAIVLCDRFDTATFAYQGFGRGVPFPLLETINGIAAGGLKSDITFIFSISVDAAFSRLSAMGKTRDRLESGDRAFFCRVAEGYRTIALRNPETMVLLDAALPIEKLSEKVYTRIREALEKAAAEKPVS
jgi:dTMP kinase